MANVTKVDKNNFNAEVLQSPKAVVVDFWAEWCGPCKALAPVLEEIAGEIGDQVSLVKVNVDENQELAQKYGIRGIPTLIFFKDGEIKKTLVGNQPKVEIMKSLQEMI